MPDTPFTLRLVEDNLHSHAAFDLPDDDANRVLYVAHGSIKTGVKEYASDTACVAKGAIRVEAGDTGAAVWRFELVRSRAPLAAVPKASGRSLEKLAAPLAWPIDDDLLVRADSVAFPPGGCAYLHTHQGPGIRCLIEGGVRIDTDGHSTSYAPGGPWFEAGPLPVFAQAASDRQSRFIRVMILPARLLGKSSIAYVNAEDRDKPKSQSYKIFADQPITV